MKQNQTSMQPMYPPSASAQSMQSMSQYFPGPGPGQHPQPNMMMQSQQVNFTNSLLTKDIH